MRPRTKAKPSGMLEVRRARAVLARDLMKVVTDFMRGGHDDVEAAREARRTLELVHPELFGPIRTAFSVRIVLPRTGLRTRSPRGS